ncbi:MAG: hypothetical protein IJN76_02965 [Clostridia bacterium]|nr:hypothetical protein [Clostridia bacterium]
MKEIFSSKKKLITTILRIVAGLAVVAIVAWFLSQASGTAELNARTDEKNPISFTPQAGTVNELQKVAENDTYILYANLCNPEIRLERKSDGAVMSSRPIGLDAMESIKNKERMELGSMLNFRYSDTSGTITTVLGSESTSRKSFAAKTMANGVRFDFYFANHGFLLPLEITLTAKGLSASVPLADIQEEYTAKKLTKITVLPNFGAGTVETGGYALVPDGSGAIIPFAQGYGDIKYQQRIYGDDAAISTATGSAPTRAARLPVFGITDTKAAVLGIITSGDARAIVGVQMPTDRNPFTTVATEFIYRELLNVEISNQTYDTTTATMYEPGHCTLDRFAVEYRMPQEPTYVGMANTYRQYLTEDKGMQVGAGSTALHVEVLGGVQHEENIAGIPVDRVLPVTSYADTLSLIDALKQRGVQNLALNYLYWYQDGTQNRLTVDMQSESRLGGDSDLEHLLGHLPADTQLYFDLNFTDLMQNQSGYTTLFSTAQNVKKEPLMRQYFLLSTYRPDLDTSKIFLLNPANMTQLVSEWAEAYAQWKSAGMNGLALGTMGEEIYSHFGDGALDRAAVQSLWESTFSAVAQQSGNGLLFTDANAYALPYASTVQSIPTEHSRYLNEERSVPFYAIALHGLVDMSVPPVNGAEGNTRVLQAVESGVGLTYTLGWRNTDQLKNTLGEQYNYICATDWLDAAARQQTELTPYLAAVSGKAIVGHTQLAADVFRTDFEGGAWAIVNYSAAAYTADGVTVEAGNYVTGGY